MPGRNRDVPSAAPFVPRDARGRARSLPTLAGAVQGCRGCDLYRYATQAVFGAGPAQARLMLVGEQPGDAEDRAGAPFVGPAGGLLDKALQAADIPRDDVYVTNAVKHFKFVREGQRRLHQKPKGLEIKACRPWLEAELEVVRPQLIVALGANAALSLLGPKFQLTKSRGQPLPGPMGIATLATFHPSVILRARTTDERAEKMEALVADLRAARAALLASASSFRATP